MKTRFHWFAIGLGIAMLAAATASAGGPPPDGDWPMSRGNLLRNNRGAARGNIAQAPAIAWRHDIGSTPASSFAADFDGDGRPETYSAENWRVVRRDEQKRVVWESAPISRSFALVGF